MADDYSINAKITADASGYESGIKKAQKASKNLSKSVSGMIQGLGKSGLVGALGAVGLATGGVTAILGTAKKAFQQIAKTVNECTEAYKVQYKAEVALETVAKNNPFIDGTNVRALKNFASEIQAVSNYGDEELLPLISNLTALGRTQEETMQILKVATDMASTGMVSLDTAVNQLNMTLNGNIGRLGMQNAELKGLTEEELKQGKAVEILGNKYKGLAESTVDTSKQLKNAIGDFKELIGQSFENALAPMRKYFTEIITNVNDVIKKAREQKKAFEEVFGEDGLNTDAETEKLKIALDSVLEEYRKVYTNQQQYLKNYGKYINEETDETAKSYREQVAQLTADIKKLSEEIVSRKKQAQSEADEQKANEERLATEKEVNDLKDKYLKKIAEQEAKWQNIKKVTGEAVTNEERLKFYQDQLVAIMTEAGGKISENNQYYKDQMAIINSIIETMGGDNTGASAEWLEKLREQRIEMLEDEKEEAIRIATEKGEQTYEIEKQYNDKIYDLKFEKITEERDKALSAENLSAEDKLNINTYYNNEIIKLDNELKKIKKKNNEEEKKDEESKFSIMLGYAKKYAENIKRVFSKIASTMKNVFSTVGNVFKKALDVFNFNPDDALTNLLKIEDAILTFFAETLPKLPSFFGSAIQSIVVLIDTLMSMIDWSKVQEILFSIIDVIIENAPTIVDNLLTVVLNIAQVLLNGIIHFVESGGWKMILNALLTIQKKLEQFVVDNIDTIVQTIVDMLPDLIQMLIDSVVSASRTLTKLIKPIIKLVMAIIEALFDFILSDEIFDAVIDVTLALIDAVSQELLPKIAYLIPKLIVKIIGFIVKNLPKLVKGIVEGLIKAFFEVNWFDVIKQIFMGFIDGFKELFGIHSPSTLFEGFGMNIIDGLVNGLKGISEAVNAILEPLYNLIANIFSSIGDTITNSIKVSFDSLKNILDSIGTVLTNLTDVSFKGFKDIIESSGNALSNITDSVTSLVKALGDLIDKLPNVNELLGLGGGSSGGGSSGGGSSGGGSSGGGSSWNPLRGTLADPDPRTNPAMPWNWHFASGTNSAPAGLALVGEAGPELVRFNGGEQVLNNRNTNKALEGIGGKTINQNITFNNLQDTTAFAMMNQLKQFNRQMAINSII